MAEAFCEETPSAVQGEFSNGTSTTVASATATGTGTSGEEGGGGEGDGGTTGATGLCGSFHCLGS